VDARSDLFKAKNYAFRVEAIGSAKFLLRLCVGDNTMIDIKQIRKNPEAIRQMLLKRMDLVDFTELLNWDQRRRKLLHEVETLKARRNMVSDKISRLKREGKAIKELTSEMRQVSTAIKQIEGTLTEVEECIQEYLEMLPNIPANDVPAGGKENNQIVHKWGKKPHFDFIPKNHVELVTLLGLVDYKSGAKLSGNGYWLYRGDGAKLEWALLNYFIEAHLKDGYEFILPPHILNYRCGYNAGQFPKFEEDVFQLKSFKGKRERTGEFLLPTSETALINMHRDEILLEEELPKKYFAYTPCFRRESGSYRSKERGMIRGHQFNKVEMFQYTAPEKSDDTLNELTKKAERLVQGLGLHYQLSKLAAKDCGAAMAKTYDIEIWIPSISEYKEVSSASNSHDYQARRGNIRFKRRNNRNTEYVHTLNASGLATSRILPALVEQFQQADGSVFVPEILRKWTGKKVLRPVI
jgi:seryl-tRNA synthetase